VNILGNIKGRETPTCRWEDNIKLDGKKWGGWIVDWIHLAWVRGQFLAR
jgi:hypothetical protein